MIGKQIAFNYSCARCACAMTSMELIMNMNNMNRFVWGFQPGTKVRMLQVFFSSLKGRISTLNEGILSIMHYSQALNRRGKENVSGQ